MKNRIVVFFVFSFIHVAAACAGVDEAKTAYDKGEYSTALQEVRSLSEQGNADAQNFLGTMYVDGKGVPQNFNKAFELFTKSANQGSAKAQINLGFMYENGQGLQKNYSEALSWYLKAAKQGFADAQDSVGYFYENGLGTNMDNNQAFYWFSKAAEQGMAGAQRNLGAMYLSGKGSSKNAKKAAFWFRKAAEQGFAPAQFGLGYLYENGEGVPKNKNTAVLWYKKAALQGYADAKTKLTELNSPPSKTMPSSDDDTDNKSADLQYDPDYEEHAEIFNEYVMQAESCMSESALVQLRVGNRNSEGIVSFMIQTCGRALSNFMAGDLKQPTKRVNAFLRAMAYQQLGKIPGVTR